tara:strand:+ start:330 stop:566 length:237 start_codon:yes stop_codon:yes gene_type:complete
MKFLDPSEHVLIPLTVSVRADTAQLLREMASEMGISMDELFSALAEDSVCDLPVAEPIIDDVFIPDRCSTLDLLQVLE